MRYFLMLPLFRLGNLLPYADTPAVKAQRRD